MDREKKIFANVKIVVNLLLLFLYVWVAVRHGWIVLYVFAAAFLASFSLAIDELVNGK